MRLVLSSNFPRPGNDSVAALVRDALGHDAGLDWLSPAEGASRFHEARQGLSAYGFRGVRAVDRESLVPPHAAAGLVLSGGDPIVFREELKQPPLRAWLQYRLATAPVVVAASGGAMQLTPNVSLFRLLQNDVETVVRERDKYVAWGRVPFEVLPHFDQHTPAFIERVRQYAVSAAVDIWCLPDGTAVMWCDDIGATAIGAARLLCSGRWVDERVGREHA